ncbi:hypothetical protein KIN20_006741 [Parelaphostrongylus tenuis]|uniref:Uncharacterized protein n=1 Tax=Parelaphostrongylus tenuis TaxID=148309 RepID=A0AAD5QL99_PARTN|nr:hypothetical protein KIN20_006741 [Parelaphostrongylus tenuis]
MKLMKRKRLIYVQLLQRPGHEDFIVRCKQIELDGCRNTETTSYMYITFNERRNSMKERKKKNTSPGPTDTGGAVRSRVRRKSMKVMNWRLWGGGRSHCARGG